MNRAGIDITRWPRRPDDDALAWFLDRVIRLHKINCVLDVGGNRGDFGLLVRSLGYTGRIVSFEPSPTVLPALNAVAERDGSWKVRPVGLSSESGTAELHLHKGPEVDSLLVQVPGIADRVPLFKEIGSATITLSTLAAEYAEAVAGLDEPRVLLKCDTQGHDLDVLKGAHGLPREIVAVLVELAAQFVYQGQPRMTRVMDLLLDEGLAPVTFQPVNRSDDTLRMVEADGLFMRSTPDTSDWVPSTEASEPASAPSLS
jgi:FkbM family methyltransferase